MINLSCKVIACGIILSSVKLEKDIRISHNLLSPPHLSPKTIAFIPSGANKQKIKILAHRQYNVRASKNAEQAFSAQ